MIQEAFLDIRLHAVDVFQSFLQVEGHDIAPNAHDTARVLMRLVGSNVPVTDNGVVRSIQSSQFGEERPWVLSKRIEEEPICDECEALFYVSIAWGCELWTVSCLHRSEQLLIQR